MAVGARDLRRSERSSAASEHARNGPSVANDARVLPAHVHWGAFLQPTYSAVAGSTTIPRLDWFSVDLSRWQSQHRGCSPRSLGAVGAERGMTGQAVSSGKTHFDTVRNGRAPDR
jgi:hypothetical protein